MSIGYIAIAGGTMYAANRASSSAKKGRRSAARAAANQLEFDKAQYDDWLDTYGDVQENLSNYYNQVTPDYYAAIGIEEFEREREQAQIRMDEYMQQRGIVGSGIEASLKMQEELGAAETKAQIRRDAPMMAAEEQSRFLQIGLGQNPAGRMSQTLAQQTAYAQQQANLGAAAAGEAYSAAGQAIGRAIDAYTNRPQTGGTP